MATVVATATDLGPLITIAGPFSAPSINALIQQAELGQPEGAQLELTVDSLGQWAPAAAALLNQRFGAGAIQDPATGEAIQGWPGASQLAYAGNGTLTLQWIKGQPWAFILIGVLIAGIVAFLFYQSLQKAPWQLKNLSPATNPGGTPSSGSSPFTWWGGSPFRLFGLPWYDAALVGGGLAVVPWAIRHVASGTQAVAAERKALRQLEGRG